MLTKLFHDPTGEFSVSKMWTNIAYAVSTIIIAVNYDRFDSMMLLTYTGVIGGSEIAKKWITMNASK